MSEGNLSYLFSEFWHEANRLKEAVDQAYK